MMAEDFGDEWAMGVERRGIWGERRRLNWASGELVSGCLKDEQWRDRSSDGMGWPSEKAKRARSELVGPGRLPAPAPAPPTAMQTV